MHKKVRFQGETYWYNDEGTFAIVLSPLNHFTKEGRLTGEGFESYAIIENRTDIMRYGRCIGHVSDLEDVKEN